MKMTKKQVEEYLQKLVQEEQLFAQQLLNECHTFASYKIVEQRVEPDLSIYILQEWEYDDGSFHQNTIKHDYDYICSQNKNL